MSSSTAKVGLTNFDRSRTQAFLVWQDIQLAYLGYLDEQAYLFRVAVS